MRIEECIIANEIITPTSPDDSPWSAIVMDTLTLPSGGRGGAVKAGRNRFRKRFRRSKPRPRRTVNQRDGRGQQHAPSEAEAHSGGDSH